MLARCYNLARMGANLREEHTANFCGIPLSAFKNRVELFLTDKAQVLWNNKHTDQHTRVTWSNLDRHNRSFLFKLSRTKLRKLDGVYSELMTKKWASNTMTTL